MKYPHGTHPVSGVLVPLAALRSAHSCGCGEFADLPALADWCVATGQHLVQLLPVNDTGGQSSPYNALSAYALHPLYIRIPAVPEYDSLSQTGRETVDRRLNALRGTHESPARFDYDAVLREKLSILRDIFEERAEAISASGDLTAFIRQNGWVKAYAVFRTLKDLNDQKPWTEWADTREIDVSELSKLWKRKTLQKHTRFHAWLQLRAMEQFAASARYLSDRGIALKGDIPILMNEDSVDAWLDRDIFRPEFRAGAPPDMFSNLGQNWGFPIYDWGRLAERDYDWWRERLRQADRYYHAYRIDHVLGFFRIWAIPFDEWSGIQGFFWPQHGIGADELHTYGFDDGRIRWLAEPHLTGDELRHHLGDDMGLLHGPVLNRLPDEDLYVFAPDFGGEKALSELRIAEAQREWLLGAWRDRALLPLPDGRYAASWTFRECSRYKTLDDEERDRFEALIASRDAENSALWADHGRTILEFMKEATAMLPCAEDLGVVPEVVPQVLRDLGILGLRIPRWARRWDHSGQPAIPFDEYPTLSVCAPSVHDTSTMRGWWERETGRKALWEMIGESDPCPSTFTPSVARTVYRAVLRSPSRIVVFQLQDLLALAPELLHTEPDEERINVPGTINDFNWTWRMPITLEELQEHTGLRDEVAELMSIRR